MANHKITIYHDGTILTMDADFPQVEALAVMDGRIVATGSLKDVKQAVGDGADLVSLEGGTLLPGFIDGHSHFCSGGMNRLYAADCAVENMEALKESLRRKLHDDRPSQWVVGHSFDEKGMEEQCYPTREILDEVSTDVPIFFRHVTGHTGIANSKALEIAGITVIRPIRPAASSAGMPRASPTASWKASRPRPWCASTSPALPWTRCVRPWLTTAPAMPLAASPRRRVARPFLPWMRNWATR